MKKLVLVLVVTTLLLTGCTVVRIDTKSIDNIIGVVLEKNNTLYNQVGKGVGIPTPFLFLKEFFKLQTFYFQNELFNSWSRFVSFWKQKNIFI